MRMAIGMATNLIGAAFLLLAGCASSRAPADGVEFRSENWRLASESGFVVTPIAAAHNVADADAATVLFTNELFSSLQAWFPEDTLITPHDTLERLNANGPDARARLRAVRRALHRRTAMDPEVLDMLSRDLGHRLVLVGWLEETASEVTQGGGYYSYGAGDAERGSDVERTIVNPLRYQKVTGTAVAVVLDMTEDEVLWRGVVSYETEPNDDADGKFAQALDRVRASAASRLADHIVGQ